MIRVGFTLVGNSSWTGGISYLYNLLEALHDFPSCGVEATLFAASEADLSALAPLLPLVKAEPVRVYQEAAGKPWQRNLESMLLQKDGALERSLRRAKVDVVFQTSTWLGFRFDLATLAWIPDFQHRHLPRLSTIAGYLKRDLGYFSLTLASDRLMLSSEDARKDCERFYRTARGKTVVVPFAVKARTAATAKELADLRKRHKLPPRFFYLPNQLWKHKNHQRVIEALDLLRAQGRELAVIASGNMADHRNPGHPGAMVDLVKSLGLDAQMRFLGLIAKEDIPLLMQASVAVVNPSLFEGWSTVVEEAKALDVQLLLSDLAVHREQAPRRVKYFDPNDAVALAQRLTEAWDEDDKEPASTRAARLRRAAAENERHRREFAFRFANACRSAIERRGAMPHE